MIEETLSIKNVIKVQMEQEIEENKQNITKSFSKTEK